MSGLPFSFQTLRRDALAGIVTGLVAVPLSVGICLMSDYPIQIGLATVVVACIVSFACYFFRPGNHVGVPGIAAGLAPVMALGVHKFGMHNMPWLIFLTSMIQMIVWKNHWEEYILKAVPPFLIEGLLAGVGLKIAMKFLPYTYETVTSSTDFWDNSRLIVALCSIMALGLFIYLYKRFKETSPGLPYILVIGISIWLSHFVPFPMLNIEHVDIVLKTPLPDFTNFTPRMHTEMFIYAAMLALIDVIEQVMSNAAIEKIDPLGRKSNSNNSLLVMWVSNLASSFIGGMTNLDGLAKSSTNRIAGAQTKVSVLFVAAVLGGVLAFPRVLTILPEFSLAVLMIFTGWKMIAGLYHVAKDGQYALGLALFCAILVFKLGIFEGLLIALGVHSFIHCIVYKHDKMPTIEILRKFIKIFNDGVHPHVTETLDVHVDPATGGLTYKSIHQQPHNRKSIDDFIADWADGVNHHNILSVVSTYDPAGLLWGTFASDLRAGHFHIKRYFEHLFELNKVRVKFESGEVRQYKDIFIKSGSYVFSYMRKGQILTIPARYSFVCKKEKTGWFILEHHSSEFPA